MITTTCETPGSVDHLRHRIRGAAFTPEDRGYDAARSAWNRNVQHRPALVVRPQHTADVQAAVRYAAGAGLGVGVMATGHGTGQRTVDGLLLNTGDLRSIHIDPVARTARVAAGDRWADLMAATAPHGLAGLPGSSPTVGVIGYTLGGGFGWLGRRYGLAAHSLTRADLVTASGDLITVDADHHPDLFWGLQGGTGNFGIVTALEFRLHPVAEVYAGNLYYPLDRSRDVLEFFAGWSSGATPEWTSAVTFRRFPPAPVVPEPLRGRTLVALRGCWSGPAADGATQIDRARAALGPAEVDTFAPTPSSALASISSDPVDPLPFRSHHEFLGELSAAAIDDLVALAGAGSGSPLVMTEVRQLGGALSGPPGALSPMAHTNAGYLLNAIGATLDADQAIAVQVHLERLAAIMGPHATGERYVNFLDPGSSDEDVRAAFSPADWARLRELKARYDPADIFRFNRNIPIPQEKENQS